VKQLDEALRGHCPALNNKLYYPSVAKPDPKQTALFADWLAEFMRMPQPPGPDV